MKTFSLFLLSICFFFPTINAQTLNLDFPSVNGQVYALAAKGDTLFIGGDFIEVGEIPRKNLAAIDLNTGSLLDWNPETDGKVDCITIDNNAVYICGEFQNINGVPRNTLGLIDATDGTVEDWNPDIVFPGIPTMQLGRVNGVGVFENIIYIGGYFLSVNGEDRSNLAALNNQAQLLSWNPYLDIPLERLEIANNTLYISGPFQNINGEERFSFASFSLNAGILTGWNPMAGSPGNSGAVFFPQEDHVYIAGFFTEVGGEERERVGKVDNNLGALLPWQVSFAGLSPIVTSFTKWEDRLFMGGDYVLDGSGSISNLSELNPETGVYTGWWANMDDRVNTLLVANDKLIVGGNFTTISNENKIGLAVYDLKEPSAVTEISEEEITVFPKPANDVVHIHIASILVDHVTLYDMNGLVVKDKNVQGLEFFTMDVENLASGIYTLVFRSADNEVLKSEIVPVVR